MTDEIAVAEVPTAAPVEAPAVEAPPERSMDDTLAAEFERIKSARPTQGEDGKFQAKAGATPATPAPAADGREPQPSVRTLAGLPAAVPAPVGDDVMGKVSLLEGEDLKKFMAKLPPADGDKLLRAAA